MHYEWHDFLGNIGVVTLLGTYLALQLGRLRADGAAYSLLNGIGAGLLCVSLSIDFNFSGLLIEVCWLGISLFGLARWYWLRVTGTMTEK